jgi:hypothetical protein
MTRTRHHRQRRPGPAFESPEDIRAVRRALTEEEMRWYAACHYPNARERREARRRQEREEHAQPNTLAT